LADGYRESTDSWAELLRSLRDRGLAAPVLAVGDGALGFWGALREVFPTTREQRCWVHRSVNVVDALPKRLHPEAKTALARIYGAESRTAAVEAVKAFAAEFSAFDKAVQKITGDLDTLHGSTSRMRRQVDRGLVDRIVEAYVDRREECGVVRGAYERWSSAPMSDRPFAFFACGAALEREEHASQVYADLITRLAAPEQRPTGIAGTVLGALSIAGDPSQAVARLVGSTD
jgi:hypothetical protein